uniref:Capsid protein n=1 Tax=Cruciviridae sp. TaxID=1955495 RepID=A0A1S6LVG2_9VIRU|nr:capsid protein [Cruciviridae sp.]
MPRRSYVRRKRTSGRPQYGRVRGRGAYSLAGAKKFIQRYVRPYTKGYLGKLGGRVGAYIGRQVQGGRAGGLAGGLAGKKVGDWLGKITGLGDYKLQRNSLVSNGQVPFMHSSRDGVRIRHREFIQDLSGSVAYTNTSFSINPGLTSSFPWLSAISQNFEEYRVEGLVFDFVSTSADALNSTNTALGTVIMAAEYNTAQPSYINKQQMENSMWALSTKPSENACMPVECAPSLNPLSNLYIRVGAVPAGTDQRLFDLCNIQVATVGMQAAAVIGELWMSYDVVLMKPQLDSGLALSAKSAHYKLTAPVVTTAYFGTAQTKTFDSIGLSLSGTVITFPIGSNGVYLMNYLVVGDSTAVTSPTFTFANCSAAPNLYIGSSVAGYSDTSSTVTRYINNTVITISDPGQIATITASVGTLPANPTSGDLLITQLNGSIA